jgi:hypothetical protein
MSAHYRSGRNEWPARTITGTANQITVTNGDGVSGNPSSALTGISGTGASIATNNGPSIAALTVTGSFTATNLVGNAALRQSGALAVVGRSANSTGNVADIQATAASDSVLRESGSVIGFGTIATAGIADNAVTNAKLRDSGALSVIGRSANSSGDPADISTSADGDILRRSGTTLGFGTVPQSSVDSLGMVRISRQTASSSATIDFTGLDSTYDAYILYISNAKPATDDVEGWLRIQTGGATWQTTGYEYGHTGANRGGALSANSESAAAKIKITQASGGTLGVGNAAGENLVAKVDFNSPDATDFMAVTFTCSYNRASDSTLNTQNGAGQYSTAGAITGIRFLFSSGNIASGEFTLVGIRRT